jgi:hypothetical protein
MAHAAVAIRAGGFKPPAAARMEALAGVPLAPFWRRVLAYVLDFAIATVIYAAAVVLVIRLFQRGAPAKPIHVKIDFHDLYSLAFIVLYFGLSLYFGKGSDPWQEDLQDPSALSYPPTLDAMAMC